MFIVTIWTAGCKALSFASSSTCPFRDSSHSTQSGISMLVICKIRGAPKKSEREKFLPSTPTAVNSGAFMACAAKTGLEKRAWQARAKRRIKAADCSFCLQVLSIMVSLSDPGSTILLVVVDGVLHVRIDPFLAHGVNFTMPGYIYSSIRALSQGDEDGRWNILGSTGWTINI